MIRLNPSWYNYVKTTSRFKTISIRSLHSTTTTRITNQQIVLAKNDCYGSSSISQSNNFSTNRGRRNSNPQNSSWHINEHTNYSRNRHSNVNRSTGAIFFVVASAAGIGSVIAMGTSTRKSEKRNEWMNHQNTHNLKGSFLHLNVISSHGALLLFKNAFHIHYYMLIKFQIVGYNMQSHGVDW